MKTFIVLLVLLFPCSLAFAGSVEVGSFYTPITKTYSGTDQASGSIVWTPKSGGRIVLMGMVGSMACFHPNTTATLGTGIRANGSGTFVNVITMASIVTGPIVIGNGVPIWQGDVDATLAVNTNKPVTAAVTLWGYER